MKPFDLSVDCNPSAYVECTENMNGLLGPPRSPLLITVVYCQGQLGQDTSAVHCIMKCIMKYVMHAPGGHSHSHSLRGMHCRWPQPRQESNLEVARRGASCSDGKMETLTQSRSSWKALYWASNIMPMAELLNMPFFQPLCHPNVIICEQQF